MQKRRIYHLKYNEIRGKSAKLLSQVSKDVRVETVKFNEGLNEKLN